MVEARSMNKTQLSHALSDKLGVPARPDCVNFIDALAVIIFDSLNRGEPVRVQGFGTFEIRVRRVGSHLRNIKTGEKYSMTHARGVRFAPSATWVPLLNGRKPPHQRIADRLLKRMTD